MRRFFSGIIALLFVIVPGALLSVGYADSSTTTVLYDGSRNTGTPDTQELLYLTDPFLKAQAIQSFADGVTTLDTSADISDKAGYFAWPQVTDSMPTLDRSQGYTVQFTVRVVAENHTSNDRAGFSIIVLSDDLRGIELGFWSDQIWAQSEAFTRAESGTFDTTAGLTTYSLVVRGDTYTLSSDATPIVSGSLRDYSESIPACSIITGCPYTTPNFLFLGDDTTSAAAEIKLSYVAITTSDPPATATAAPSASATATLTATLTAAPTSTPPRSPTPGAIAGDGVCLLPLVIR